MLPHNKTEKERIPKRLPPLAVTWTPESVYGLLYNANQCSSPDEES